MTAASRSGVGKVNASPSPAHGSPNIRHRLVTMSFVFDHEQFVVQMVFTASSKTVAHRSSPRPFRLAVPQDGMPPAHPRTP